MPDGVNPGIQLGSYPDRVQGTEFVEAAEEQYKLRYALAICNALKQADPQTFNEFFGGSMEECVRRASAFADYNFDMWKVNWSKRLASSIALFK